MAGNQNSGRKQEKPFRDALRIEMLAAENNQESPAPVGSLRWNARQLLIKGDVQSIKEIADRLDGKVPQAVIGDEENPLNFVHTIKRQIVRADFGNPDS